MYKIERGGWIRDNLPHPSSDFEIQRTRTCFIYFEKLVSISTIILQELNGEIQWNKSDKRNYFYFHQIIHRSILWSSFNSSSNLVWIGDDWRIIFLSRNELPFYNNSNNFLPRVSIFPMECVLQTTNKEREREEIDANIVSNLYPIRKEFSSVSCVVADKGASRPQGAAVRTQIQDADVWNGNLALSVHKQNGP